MFDDESFFKQAFTEDQAKFDARLPVKFEWFDQEDPEASKKSGFTRYKRVQVIRTLIPGSKEERVDLVREEHKQRFPRAWAAFEAGEEGVVDGTPLKDFPGLTKDDISALTHFHVLSVEQLASLSDEQASNLGHGFRQKRDSAKAWAVSRKAAQPIAELNAKLREKDEQVAALMERLSVLEGASPVVPVAHAASPEVAQKSKRVRKPKQGAKANGDVSAD